MELLRRSHPFWCLSVDESRDTVKNIFALCTVIITYFDIIEYLMSYVPHSKGLNPRISKIYIPWKSNQFTGSNHIFPILVAKMTNFDPDIRNGHVIHQNEANEPRITKNMVLTKNFDLESKYTEKLKFWKFSPVTS